MSEDVHISADGSVGWTTHDRDSQPFLVDGHVPAVDIEYTQTHEIMRLTAADLRAMLAALDAPETDIIDRALAEHRITAEAAEAMRKLLDAPPGPTQPLR